MNFKKYSEFNNTNWHIINLKSKQLKISEPADAIFVDIPQPWELINFIRYLLKDGHPIGFLYPSFEQVKLTANVLNDCVALLEFVVKK